ncbi:MAG: hypothetical protein L7R84_00680 [Balneolaceae bacterium]|nr:hypothetical protein [Balneolaceae bacterium]
MILKSYLIAAYLSLALLHSLGLKANEYAPKYWPPFVETNQAIHSEDNPESVLVPKSKRGVFMRFSDDRILVDFGRYGIHIVDLESTNFRDAYAEIVDQPKLKDFPNFTGMIGTRTLTYKRTYEMKNFNDLKLIKHWVILITPEIEMDIASLEELSRKLEKKDSEVTENELILFPGNFALYKKADSIASSLKYIAPGVNWHYRKALALPLGKNHQESYHLFKLCANGQIVAQSTDLKTIESVIQEAEQML